MVFVLTACIGQAIVYVLKRPRLTNSRGVTSRNRNRPVSSPVAVETSPHIDFPKSLRTMHDLDFWVPLSMVVESDGSVRDIQVDLDRAVTEQGISFSDEVLSKTSAKQRVEITGELVEVLSNEVKDMKFKPRTFNGQSLPTMVFVDSHFRSTDKSCRRIESEFRTSEGIFWSVLMRNDDGSCVEGLN